MAIDRYAGHSGRLQTVRNRPIPGHRRPLFDQRGSAYSQRLGKLLDDRDGRVPRCPLDIADVGAVDAGPAGKLFLAPALLKAKPL